MTDTQIFAFLVMPFLFVLTCNLVFFSRDKRKTAEPASPPEPVTKASVYTRKPRKRVSAQQADAIKD